MPTQKLLPLPLFEGVDASALEKLGLRPLLRTFSAGQTVFNRDDPSRDVCFVISGRLLCVLWTNEGKEIQFSRIAAGTYFGELSAIDARPRSLDVYAQTQSEILVLRAPDFQKILDAVPTINRRVMSDLVQRVRTLTNRLHQSTSHSVEQRVRAYLAKLTLEAGPVGRIDRADGSGFFDAPSHAEIANSIGANREAVTRAIATLKRQGVLDTGRQRIRILLPDKILEWPEDEMA